MKRELTEQEEELTVKGLVSANAEIKELDKNFPKFTQCVAIADSMFRLTQKWLNESTPKNLAIFLSSSIILAF